MKPPVKLAIFSIFCFVVSNFLFAMHSSPQHECLYSIHTYNLTDNFPYLFFFILFQLSNLFLLNIVCVSAKAIDRIELWNTECDWALGGESVTNAWERLSDSDLNGSVCSLTLWVHTFCVTSPAEKLDYFQQSKVIRAAVITSLSTVSRCLMLLVNVVSNLILFLHF